MTRTLLSLALVPFLLPACGGSTGEASLDLEREALTSPAGTDSGEPFLAVGSDGVYLSWLEAAPEGRHDLRFARYDGQRWSEPLTVASSERFFVNWADFPSVRPAPDGSLWAHWLRRGEAGGYDYGVRIARSLDGGATWTDPWTLHEDTSPTEHGFVSATALEDGMAYTWLDGRKYAEGPGGGEPTNEMTLRHRLVDFDGTPGPEMLVDGRVCDCCQTATARTDEGPITAYRDRSAEEIRDIYVARSVDGAWTEGAPVHRDGWEIAGCPVNGPAIAARGMEVAVAWFTAAGDVPRVKVAFSSDGGATFGGPTVLDDGNPAGRVDLVLQGDGSALVTWLERTGGDAAEVRVRRVERGGGMTESVTLAGSSGARASGFPRIADLGDGQLLLAWTDLEDDTPQVRVARLRLDDTGQWNEQGEEE